MYNVGDRVRITNLKSKYYNKHATVVREYIPYGRSSKCVDLYVDDTRYQEDELFGNNCLTLVNSSVELIKKEENTNMKLYGYQNVAVIEIADKDYYYALYDQDIVVGDTVLVTGRNSSLVEVKDVIPADIGREICPTEIREEVKCKVDLSAYEQRVKNREEANKLKKKIEAEIKKMDELHKYEIYAEQNPDLKEMVEQFKVLMN